MPETMDHVLTLDTSKLAATLLERYETGVRIGLEDNKAHIVDVDTLRLVDTGDTENRAFARGYFDGLVQNWGETGVSLQYGPSNMRVTATLHPGEGGGRVVRSSTLNTSLFRGGLLTEISSLLHDEDELIRIQHLPIEGRPLGQYHFKGEANGLLPEAVNMFIIAPSLEVAVKKFASRVNLADEITIAS